MKRKLLAEKLENGICLRASIFVFLISQRPRDYVEIRVLLKDLIDAMNSIGVNVNQIARAANASYFGPEEQYQLMRCMTEIKQNVRAVNKAINDM